MVLLKSFHSGIRRIPQNKSCCEPPTPPPHSLSPCPSPSALLDQSQLSIPAGQSERCWVMSCSRLLCGADAAELQSFSLNRENRDEHHCRVSPRTHECTHLHLFLYLLIFFLIVVIVWLLLLLLYDLLLHPVFTAHSRFHCSHRFYSLTALQHSFHLFISFLFSSFCALLYLFSFLFFLISSVLELLWAQLCRSWCAYWQQWHHRLVPAHSALAYYSTHIRIHIVRALYLHVPLKDHQLETLILNSCLLMFMYFCYFLSLFLLINLFLSLQRNLSLFLSVSSVMGFRGFIIDLCWSCLN